MGSTTDCNIVRLATTRATTTTSPSSKTHVPRIHAQFRAFPSRLPCAQSFPVTSRSRSKQIHSVPRQTYTTQHFHQNCLCTITSSYRRLANNYTLLLNASTTIQYVGLVWNPPTHLSVCHSAIAYTF